MINMMDSPLNLAHQQGRKADTLIKTGKYDEAIACHNRAAELILEAMQQTTCGTAKESLKLQHAHHLKQTDQLFDRQRRAQILQIKQTKSQFIHQSTQTLIQGPVISANVDQSDPHTFRLSQDQVASENIESISPLDDDPTYRTLTEQDSLIGLLIRRTQNADGPNLKSLHSGVPIERVFYSKPNISEVNSEKNQLEELRCLNEDLQKHIKQLLQEVDELKRGNKKLQDKISHLESGNMYSQSIFSEVGGSGIDTIPDLPPLEMPTFDLDLLERKDKKDSSEDLLGQSY